MILTYDIRSANEFAGFAAARPHKNTLALPTTSKAKEKNMIFYHITTPEQWAKFDKVDYLEADSLATEGFIHGSYAEQVDASVRLYFQGCERVLILKIDPTLLTAKLVTETSRNGDLFPHIYGQLNKSAILEIENRLMT